MEPDHGQYTSFPEGTDQSKNFSDSQSDKFYYNFN